LEEEAKALAIPPGRRVYDEAVKSALILIWEAADRICGKRLKAVIPMLITAMERVSASELGRQSLGTAAVDQRGNH